MYLLCARIAVQNALCAAGESEQVASTSQRYGINPWLLSLRHEQCTELQCRTMHRTEVQTAAPAKDLGKSEQLQLWQLAKCTCWQAQGQTAPHNWPCNTLNMLLDYLEAVQASGRPGSSTGSRIQSGPGSPDQRPRCSCLGVPPARARPDGPKAMLPGPTARDALEHCQAFPRLTVGS